MSAELAGEVYIIDRAEFEVIGKIKFFGAGALKATVADLLNTRNGRTAYVALAGVAQVPVIDVSTRRIRDYIPVGERSSGLGITHDERTLFVTNVFGNDITAIDIVSHRVTASVSVGRRPWSLVVDDWTVIIRGR